MRRQGNGTVTQSEESITRMTPYRLPHHGNRSFAAAQDDILRLSSPQRQTLHIRLGWQLTIFLPRVYRSFTFVQDDDWRFPHYDALPSPVILNGGKNALWKRREAAIWHKAKNLLLGWHLAVFLTTAADPSLAPWMTISVSCHYDDFFRRLSNAGKTVRMICAGARLFPK